MVRRRLVREGVEETLPAVASNQSRLDHFYRHGQGTGTHEGAGGVDDVEGSTHPQGSPTVSQASDPIVDEALPELHDIFGKDFFRRRQRGGGRA